MNEKRLEDAKRSELIKRIIFKRIVFLYVHISQFNFSYWFVQEMGSIIVPLMLYFLMSLAQSPMLKERTTWFLMSLFSL